MVVSKVDLHPAMTPAWYTACNWLKENTPEPFEQEDFYTARSLGVNASYEVMSWWDWGFFIIEEGHRVPVADPGQRNVLRSADFLVNGVGDPQYVILGDHRGIYPAFEVWLGMKIEGNRVYESFYWELYEGNSDRYELVFQAGEVKIFERN